MRGPHYGVNCLPGPREPFERDAMDLAPGAIEGAGAVFSQKKSDTIPRSTLCGWRHLMISLLIPKNKIKTGDVFPIAEEVLYSYLVGLVVASVTTEQEVIFLCRIKCY